MKRTVLIVAGLLTGVTTAWAKDLKSNINENNVIATKHYRNAQPIVFVERQVEFFIFPDGSFDFNSNFNDNHYNSRRNTINASYNSPNVNISYSSRSTKNNYISRDRNGTIRSIGNVQLNYDYYGRITRVGSIFMDYGRGKNGTLTQVGNLRVNYNHWGEIVSTRGFINQQNRFNDFHSSNNVWVNNNQHCDNDDKYYYYKSNGKIKKQEKIK